MCKYVCVQPQEIEEKLDVYKKKSSFIENALQSEEGCKSFKIKKSISIKTILNN